MWGDLFLEQAQTPAVDILPAASGEDSYGLRCFCGGFGGFLPQPPYFSGGQRRGFTFGLARPQVFWTKTFFSENTVLPVIRNI
jgi:hypothetical protein